jgi:hypothetical protein
MPMTLAAVLALVGHEEALGTAVSAWRPDISDGSVARHAL